MTPAAPSPADIRLGVTLRHYKGGVYRVVGLCRIEATLKTGVLYRACQGDEEVVWMRPLAEFSDVVTTADGPAPRFAVVTA